MNWWSAAYLVLMLFRISLKAVAGAMDGVQLSAAAAAAAVCFLAEKLLLKRWMDGVVGWSCG